MSTLETLQDLLMHDHQLTPEQVAAEARLPDLGIDSLALVELMFQVEDRFGIEVPLEDPDALQTLGDVARYVDTLIARGPSRSGGAGARSAAARGPRPSTPGIP